MNENPNIKKLPFSPYDRSRQFFIKQDARPVLHAQNFLIFRLIGLELCSITLSFTFGRIVHF